MLESNLLQQLRDVLQGLQKPVELIAQLDSSERSEEIKRLMQDLTEVSPMITWRTGTLERARTPSFGLSVDGLEPRVVFSGLPLGHEFTSLILALLQVNGYPPKVDVHVVEAIRALDKTLHFDAYVSLSCHNCPDVVQAINTMAALNPKISATMIDGAWHQEEAEERGIMAVPALHLNGQPFGSGRMSLEEILAKVDNTVVEKTAKNLALKEPFDVLIVGGGPAGAAAAVYVARKGVRTGIVAMRFGGQTNDTMGIENYISVLETNGPKFAADLLAHVRHYNVDVMTEQEVSAIIPASETSPHIEVHTKSGAILRTKTVILTMGARWRNMNIPGEQQYRNKGVAYCPHCDGPLFKGKHVAVIGGGNSGVEAAIDLAGIAAQVTLLEYEDSLKADVVLQEKLKSLPNVSVICSARTREVLGDVTKVTGLQYENRRTKSLHTIELEGIFVQIGLVPNTDFTHEVLQHNSRGEIITDARQATSVPGVFAAGDCTDTPYKQIIIAAGDGAKAALSAFDYLIRY